MNICKRCMLSVMILIGLQLFICAPSHSTSIEVISQSYSITAWDLRQWPGMTFEPINLNSTTPLYVELPYGYGSAEASSNISPSNVSLAALFGSASQPGTATAGITFRILGESPSLYLNYWGLAAVSGSMDARANLELFDVTTGTLLAGQNQSWVDGEDIFYDMHTDIQRQIAVDPSHIYALGMTAYSLGGDAAWAEARISIPEPMSILLLGLGLIGLAGMRRKFKK